MGSVIIAMAVPTAVFSICVFLAEVPVKPAQGPSAQSPLHLHSSSLPFTLQTVLHHAL